MDSPASPLLSSSAGVVGPDSRGPATEGGGPASAASGLASPEALSTGRVGAWAWVWMGLLLAPSLVAVAWYPAFVTQDGPAHAYNAEILLEALAGRDTFAAAYRVEWKPVPNWAGHMALMGLMAVGVEPRQADRVVMGLTLAGVAIGVLVLRRAVAGGAGVAGAAVLSALLGLNVMWLYGFYGYLLGCWLFGVTLAVWWSGRARPGLGLAVWLGLLLTAGYFAHPVSLGLTVAGLGVLAAVTPVGAGGWAAWRRRAVVTALGMLPLIPLGVAYRRIMRAGGGPLDPVWMVLTDGWSVGAWVKQLGWVDPITLGSKLALPFVAGWRREYMAGAPVLWLTVGLGILVVGTVKRRRGGFWRDERRGFGLLAVLLLAGGVAGPDALGHGHGHFLAQRVALLGLVALVPWLEIDVRRRVSRVGLGLIGVALVVQTAFVWDYARWSEARVGPVVAARGLVGTDQRVGSLWVGLRQPFRPNALTHADCLLGLGTRNVIWGNYESAHYYFPVRVRDDVPHPPVLAFESISLLDQPSEREERAEAWAALLEAHHETMDRVVVWGEDPLIEKATRRWYRLIGQTGRVRVYAPAGTAESVGVENGGLGWKAATESSKVNEVE